MTMRKAATLDDLWSGSMLGVSIDGVPVLLVNLDGMIRAFEDRCQHQGVKLSEGSLRCGVITCFAHAWQYDARTGKGINPERVRLRSFRVDVRGDDVLVDVAEQEAR
jgi:toluene monooxygenase system ferredoxin subunit